MSVRPLSNKAPTPGDNSNGPGSSVDTGGIAGVTSEGDDPFYPPIGDQEGLESLTVLLVS